LPKGQVWLPSFKKQIRWSPLQTHKLIYHMGFHLLIERWENELNGLTAAQIHKNKGSFLD